MRIVNETFLSDFWTVLMAEKLLITKAHSLPSSFFKNAAKIQKSQKRLLYSSNLVQADVNLYKMNKERTCLTV